MRFDRKKTMHCGEFKFWLCAFRQFYLAISAGWKEKTRNKKTYCIEKLKINTTGINEVCITTKRPRITSYNVCYTKLLRNFTLLDESTNKSYGNAIFSAKRRVILGKDQGKKITVDDNFEIKESKSASAFIPPCTKNVFLKYYNPRNNFV